VPPVANDLSDALEGELDPLVGKGKLFGGLHG